jgi:uncharacterized protein
MKKPAIFRKRYIPDETIDITRDELVFRSEELLITKWSPIKPRQDISKGISYTFLKEGIKVSKFFDHSGMFSYWYIDIIEVEYDAQHDVYTLVDLLVDVKLTNEGVLQVLDADELAQAIETGLVTCKQACNSLRKLDKVLNMIYNNNFPPKECTDEDMLLGELNG